MMNIFNSWLFFVILYLFFAVLFNQNYKVATIGIHKDGALTILIGVIAGIISLLMFPLFKLNVSTDLLSYIFLFLACIFYALNDRLSTTARKGMEASTYSILKQLQTVFMIILGLLFFNEAFIINKMFGAFLILFSNALVLYQRNIFKFNKYIFLGLMANLCLTIALFIDVNYSNQFNLPIYVAITILVPALLILIVEKIKLSDIILEYRDGNRKSIIMTSLSWAIMMIAKLRAYQLGQLTMVAPLCSLTVILDVLASYVFLKERSHLLRKIIASIIIIIGIIIIKI